MTVALIAAIIEQMQSPFALVLGANGAMTVAIAKIYSDCRTDRESLWKHIRELEQRINRK